MPINTILNNDHSHLECHRAIKMNYTTVQFYTTLNNLTLTDTRAHHTLNLFETPMKHILTTFRRYTE